MCVYTSVYMDTIKCMTQKVCRDQRTNLGVSPHSLPSLRQTVVSIANSAPAALSLPGVFLSWPLSLSRSDYRCASPCPALCRSGDLNLDPQDFMASTLHPESSLQPYFCG